MKLKYLILTSTLALLVSGCFQPGLYGTPEDDDNSGNNTSGSTSGSGGGSSDTAPVASNITPAAFNEDTESGVITLSYTDADGDKATSCTLANLTNVTETTACSCDGAGVCTVKVTGTANSNGAASFTYTVTANSATSNSATATLSITAVNDNPTISNISDTSTNEDVAKAVNFTIGDVDDSLACNGTNLSMSSSDTSVVPNANVVWSGTQPNCTATITPDTNQSGSSNITITVSDGTGNANDVFTLTVNAVNDAPTISDISNTSTNEDVAKAVNFTISDADHVLACNSTYLSMSSSDTGVVPNANVVWSGTAPNCTATITPAADQNGSSNITVTVSDGTDNNNDVFTLTVNAVNDAPTISDISNTSTNEDVAKAVNFTINDVDDSLSCNSSFLSLGSSNTTLLPTANVVWSGTAPNCTATLTPASDQTGSTTVTITVSDGTDNNNDDFTLTVNAVNDAPTISSISNTSTNEDVAKAVNFTINDVDDALACNATYLSMSSSNTTIVPNANVVWSGTAPNCTATITPAANENGAPNITITVDDGTDNNNDVFTLTVTAVDDAPVASNITPAAFNQDTESVITLSYTDVESDLATSCAVSSLTNVTETTACSCNGGGVCTVGVTGTASYSGAASFNYTVTANSAVSNTASATLTINSTADYVVDDNGDAGDANTGDGNCATAGAVCTLRAAVEQANATAGTQTIQVPSSMTITLGSVLTVTSDITINGTTESTSIIDGNDATPIFSLTGADTLTLSKLTLQNGYNGSNHGGAITATAGGTLVISYTTLKNNDTVSTKHGGAINLQSSSSLDCDYCTFDTNTGKWGGAIRPQSSTIDIDDSYFKSNTASGLGGAIFAVGATAVVNIDNTLFELNTASGTSEGGAFALRQGTATIKNTTFSKNNSNGDGGAVGVGHPTQTNATLTLINCTFEGNYVASGKVGGAITVTSNSNDTITYENTIFYNNYVSPSTSDNCNTDGGTLTSNGDNISDTTSGDCSTSAGGDANSTDPLLDTLGPNGGFTKTYALLAGSPAIDTGDNTNCPATDQRGASYPRAKASPDDCDKGAFEVQP